MTPRRSLWLALIVICGLCAPANSTQNPSTAEASILLSARDKYDRVINNLRKEDIRVFDEGNPRPITRFENADDLPISVEVLIDTSASTTNQSPAVSVLAKLFLDLTIRKGKDTATISSFGSGVNLVQSATDNIAQLYSAIDQIRMQPASGRTRIFSAVLASANRLAALPGRRIVFLVSDGMDNSDGQPSEKKLIETLQESEIAIYPMYCFCPKSPRESSPLRFSLDSWGSMRILAEATGGIPYLPGTLAAPAIERDLRQITREMAAQRVVSFQPGPRKDPRSLRKIRIEVANPELKGLKLKYRQRY